MSITKLKPTDVVIIGMGWMGGIMAKELSSAGLKVVGFERGPKRSHEEFSIPNVRDELKFASRLEVMSDTSRETITFRHGANDLALPMRRQGAFLLGEGVGGSGVHWNGWTLRYSEKEFKMKSRAIERYGKSFLPDYMTIQDWPVTYDELEPFYDKFEYTVGISGKAGNINGARQAGGNPLESWRKRDFPNPPLISTNSNLLFDKSARSLGYNPYPMPAANASEVYTNPDGVTFGRCLYCGFCERFGCEANAKGDPSFTVIPVAEKTGNFTLRPLTWVNRILKDKSGKRVTGVLYTDLASGNQFEQPADLVILAAHPLNNVHQLLISQIGKPYDPVTLKGHVGRNYSYQSVSVSLFFHDDINFNPFIAAGGTGVAIDDFNGDNFDHAGLGFIGGGAIFNPSMGGRPMQARAKVPTGTPRWGTQWKEAVAKWYQHSYTIVAQGLSASAKQNFLDLDPTYKNIFGDPLMRMTFNFTQNDLKLSKFLLDKVNEIGNVKKPNHSKIVNSPQGEFNIVPYQSSHNSGGAIMGTSSADSVVNKFSQHWDYSNLFVVGASSFPQNPGYHPTGTAGAIAFFSANAIKDRYLKNPGPLV